MSVIVEFDLPHFLAEERTKVEEVLGKALRKAADRIPPELLGPMRHGVLVGGKRLRPILCVESFRTCGGEVSPAVYDLGISLEFIHAYSLMHDDLPCMDDAELRRGEPTAHRVYGEVSTMRAGAALIPLAGMQAHDASMRLGASENLASRITTELMQAAGAGGMVGGQVLDLLGEGRSLDRPELDALHRKKTGALLRACLRIGGLASGASEDQLRAVTEYGEAVGLAFQIADDVLDATASAAALGKNPSDAALGKSTYVTLHGLDEARRLARLEVERAVSALRSADLTSPPLEAVAHYIVERDR